MKKETWLFLSKVVPISAVLGYLWFTRWQVRYPFWIDDFAEPILQYLGARSWKLALVLEHFTNMIPYVSLVLASPGIIKRWRRTIVALVVGLVVLIMGHILLSLAVDVFFQKYELSRQFYRIVVPMYIINDALPLALWILFYPRILEQLFGLTFTRRVKSQSTPGATKPQTGKRRR